MNCEQANMADFRRQSNERRLTVCHIGEQLVCKYGNFNLNRKLPLELRTLDAGDHLYQIGASFDKLHPAARRYRLHHPILFLCIIACIFTRSLATMLYLQPSETMLLFWIGDISVIVNLRFHFNLVLITYDFIIYGLVIFHYLDYRNQRPRGLNPNMGAFELASGLVSPRKLGLSDRRKVIIFAKLAQSSLTAVKYFTRYVLNIFVFCAFFLVFNYRLMEIRTIESVVVALLHSIVWMLKNHIFFTFFCYHMLYFYLICFYLRIKLSGIIESLSDLSHPSRRARPRRDAIKIYNLLMAIEKVQLETSQLNERFWSKVIVCIWSGFIVNISAFLFTTLFGDINWIVRLICALVLGLEMLSVTMLCVMASSVHTKASLLFNSLYKISLGKVPVRLRFKLAVWCEVTARPEIGFTCGSFFLIRHMTYLEMIAFTASIFLKLVQLRGVI